MLKPRSRIFASAAIAVFAVVAMFGGGKAVLSSADENLRVKMDEAYLKSAVVSELPVELSSRVIDEQGNYIYGKEVVYSVASESGIAEIKEGNLLYLSGTGAFTVTAALSDGSGTSDVRDCYANELTFSNVRILSRIENVTIYTQPIYLTGSVDVEGVEFPEDEHYELCFEVEEGPAEIFTGGYLRFTGEGLVKLKAYSRYDRTAFVTKEISVTDPDKGLDVSDSEIFKQGELEVADGGCKSSFSSAGLTMIFALSGFSLFWKRKR